MFKPSRREEHAVRPTEPELRRLREQQLTHERLMARALDLKKIVEHRRSAPHVGNGSERPERLLRGCIHVELWVESDGSESVVVNGSRHGTTLELKGLLHDAIYALAHEAEPGFTTSD